MPGRAQALMRTRCPACGTVFRVTSEQLRLKAGKVRCGHCQTVFNAFDEFLPEEAPPAVRVPAEPAPPAFAPLESQAPSGHEPDWPEIVEQLPQMGEPGDEAGREFVADGSMVSELEAGALPQAEDATADPTSRLALTEAFDHELPAVADSEPLPAPLAVEATALPQPAAAEADPVFDPATEPLPEPVIELPPDGETALAGPADGESGETPEQSTLAAREAGLVAARELSDAPAYNRWAAGTLADGGASAFASTTVKRAVWPFVLVAGLLLLALAGQLLQHFRTEVVRGLPASAPYYELLGVSVPLSRNPELVAIEASDLQSDNVRGLFVLQATLHNRAGYPQDWPALELTLTDAADSVVARKVMAAAEYLPPTISPELFPANGEVAIRLWIEARNLGAAGYRLYVFYP